MSYLFITFQMGFVDCFSIDGVRLWFHSPGVGRKNNRRINVIVSLMHAIQKKARNIDIVLMDEIFRDVIRPSGNQRVYTTVRADNLNGYKNLFVVSKATELSGISDMIRKYNQNNRLRGLFIRPDIKKELLPHLMYESGVRSLKNTMIFETADSLLRVFHAWKQHAEDQLVADASVLGNLLYVVSCSFKMYRVAFDDIPALTRIRPQDRNDFVIDEDGSYIHWPIADIHVDIETLMYHTNDEFRRSEDLNKIRYHKNLGVAVKQIRKSQGVRQSDITGFSARQVRRIENGDTPLSSKSLKILAAALSLTPEKLLDKIASDWPLVQER